jgi:hypothetical protein
LFKRRSATTRRLLAASSAALIVGGSAIGVSFARAQESRVFSIAGAESAGLTLRTACALEICTDGSSQWLATEKRLHGGCVGHRPDGTIFACSYALISVDHRGRARPHGTPLSGPASEVRDVDVASDGAVVVLEVEGEGAVWRVWRIGLDGSGAQLGRDIQSGNPRAVAAAPDGSAFALDGGRQIVTRMSLDGTVTRVAGSYREGTTAPQGFSGDGGPATEATFSDPSDIDVLPDGSLVLADTDNARIRRVAPDGVIDTIAGGGSGWREGALSTTVALGAPRVVRATPDGGLLIAARRGLLRRDPTGAVHTIARVPATAWGGAMDAGDAPDRLDALNTDGRRLAEVSLAEIRDVDQLPDRTLVLSLGSRIALLASAGATERLAVALPASNRVTIRRGVVSVRATHTATARMELLRRGRIVASRRARLLAGRAIRLRLRVRASTAGHTLRVTARDAGGAQASHRLSVVPGGTLGPQVLQTLTRWVERYFSFAKSGRTLDRCRRLSARAFRCRTTVIADTVSRFTSLLRLRRDGLLSYDSVLFEPPGLSTDEFRG